VRGCGGNADTQAFQQDWASRRARKRREKKQQQQCDALFGRNGHDTGHQDTPGSCSPCGFCDADKKSCSGRGGRRVHRGARSTLLVSLSSCPLDESEKEPLRTIFFPLSGPLGLASLIVGHGARRPWHGDGDSLSRSREWTFGVRRSGECQASKGRHTNTEHIINGVVVTRPVDRRSGHVNSQAAGLLDRCSLCARKMAAFFGGAERTQRGADSLER
jgi:hypothetical protein